MNNRDIGAALNMIGTMLEILDDNSFRSTAYYNAGRKIEAIEKPLQVTDLEGMSGVGPALREKISDMITKGYSSYLEKLRSEIPAGLLEVLRIPNLGPKRVRTLWRDLGITNLQELEEACHQGKLQSLKGFGEKLQEKIIQGLRHLKEFSDRFLLGEAVPISRDILRELSRAFHVKHFSLAGSARRGCELVRNLDVVTTVENLGELEAFLKNSNLATSTSQPDPDTLLAKLTLGIPLCIHRATSESLGASLVYFTGSKSHGDKLISLARSKGLDFGPRGLFSGSKRIPTSTEAQVYDALGLAYIEPELREDSGELDQSPLPLLLNRSDLVGTVHVHTTWSDGVNTLEEMVSQAHSMGFRYVGISDHSKSAVYAGGLTPERLQQQKAEINQLQTRFPAIRILQGTECDILADGSLDYPDEVLRNLDFVIGSIHSQFNMSEEEMTRRVIRALEHPLLDILGHPTGRLLLGRAGFRIDLDRVLDAAKKNGKVIEINDNPHRLDLETKWVRAAREKRVMMSIDPDAHNRLAITDVDYGVTLARRGWVSRETILNAERPEKALDYFRRHR